MLVQLLKIEKTNCSFTYRWIPVRKYNIVPFVMGTIALAPKAIPAWVGFAVTGGMAAISIGVSYLTKPNTPSTQPGAFDNPVVDPETFLPVLYGKTIMPFLPVFMDTHPENINLLMGVGGQCHGRIQGLYKIYFGNMELVTKLADDTYEVSEKFKGKVEFWQRRGGDTPQPYEDFVNIFRKWTSKHLGAGVASIAFRIHFDKDNITSIPSIQLVYKGKLLYDPRTKKSVSSITRSGNTATVTTSSVHELETGNYIQIFDANQSDYNGISQVTVTNTTVFTFTVLNTPVTPATGTIYLGKVSYKTNPVLAVLDYLTHAKYGTNANMTTGIDVDSFIAEANYCDELIDHQIVDTPKKAPKVEIVERPKDWLTSGSTYKYKYSYCNGTIIADEGEAYTAYESDLSPEMSSPMTLSSAYGKVKLTGLLDSSDSTITLKKIYRQKDGTGSYYYIGAIDSDETTFVDNIADIDVGDAHSASVSPPTAPTGIVTAVFTNYANSALDTNKYYRYKFALVTSVTPRNETAPSPASKRIKTKSNNTALRITGIPDSEDSTVDFVRIYRSEGFSANADKEITYKHLVDVANGTSVYVDLIADGSLDGAVNPLASSTTTSSQIKRFTCNGLLDTGEDISTNREKLLSSCRGKLYKQAGKWKIFIPKVVVSETFELNENNIIGDWSFSLLGAGSMPNTVKASFINPDTEWKSDTVIWPKIDEDNLYLKDDNGLKSNITLDLPFTTDKYTAKTICQVIRKEARNNVRVELTAKEEARKLTVGRCVKLTHSMPGWTEKKFWVEAVGLFPNATIRLILLEYTETDYNYETLTEDILPGSDTTFPDPTEPPDEVTTVVLAEEPYYENQSKHWRLKGTFINPTSAFWSYSEVYVKIGSGDYTLYTSINKESSGIFYIDPVEEFSLYSIKILSVSTLGAKEDIDSVENTTWTHNTGNTTEPPNVSAIYASVRGDIVELNWPEVVDPETGKIPFDFDCYEIQETAWQVGGAYIVRTRSTRQILSGVSNGTHTYFIKARDKATLLRNGDGSISPIQGNESVTAAESAPVTVTSVSSEEMSAPHDFGAAKSVSSLTRSGTTASATVTGHGFSTGDWVVISGANQAEYNVTTEITVTDVDTFTYSVSGSPTTPATGTILCNSGGSHTGTEQYNHGTHGLILRMKQNYLSGDNINFEGGVGNWALGSGWSRTGTVSTVTPKSGSYMIMCPASSNGSYSGLTGSGLEAISDKQYIFKAWVWCNKPSTARIAMLVDSSGITYSPYHPGDNQWHILFVVKTVTTPAGTPTIYFKTENTIPTATSFFDYCGFARYYGDYISPTYDMGSVDIRRFWLEYNDVSSSTLGEAPAGTYLIDLMISDNGVDFTTYSGMESSEQIVSGQYIKYKIKFINIWIDQVLYIKKMISGDGLKVGNPSGMIGTNFYIPLGNIVIGEG